MSSSESPSYSSSRIQRAYRINKIEQSRLSGTLHLLDKQKVHQMRLTNQDIRTISVSLDYIQSSSGKSHEGVPPQNTKSDTEGESSGEDDVGPYFMYGERIVSRRTRRFRAQSALERGRSRRGSVSSVLSDSVTSLPDRPQSSPARRPPSFLWQISRTDDSDKHSNSSSERTDVVDIASGRRTVKYDWEHATSEVTKKVMRAQAEKRKDPRRSLPTSIRRRGAFNDMSSSSASPVALPSPSRPGSSPNLYPPRRAPVSSAPGRNVQLSEILNQKRPTMSASQWRSHLSQTHTTPMSMTAAREQMQMEKLRVNDSARVKIQARVQGFLETC